MDNFLGEILLVQFFGRNFLGGIFWENSLGIIFLEGIFWEKFFVYTVKVTYAI